MLFGQQYAISLIHLRFANQPVSFQVIGSTIWAFGWMGTTFDSGLPVAGLPIVFSSVDGGTTWVEADPTHRPNNQGGNAGLANIGGKQIYDPSRGKFFFMDGFVNTPTLTQSKAPYWGFDTNTGLYDNGGVANVLVISGDVFTTGHDQGSAFISALTYFSDGSYVLMLSDITSFTTIGPAAFGTPIVQFRSTDGGVSWGSSSVITTIPTSNVAPQPNPHYQVVSIVPTSATNYVGLLSISSQPDGSGGYANPIYYITGNTLTGVATYTLVTGTNITYTQSAFKTVLGTNVQPITDFCGGVTFGGNSYFSFNYSDDSGVTYSPGVLKAAAGPTITFTKISPAPSHFSNTGIGLNHLGNPVTTYGFGSARTDSANTSILAGGVWGATSPVLVPPEFGASPTGFADYGSPHTNYNVYFPVPFSSASTDYIGVLANINNLNFYPGILQPFPLVPPPPTGSNAQLVLQ